MTDTNTPQPDSPFAVGQRVRVTLAYGERAIGSVSRKSLT
jgi:hypothetical protein